MLHFLEVHAGSDVGTNELYNALFLDSVPFSTVAIVTILLVLFATFMVSLTNSVAIHRATTWGRQTRSVVLFSAVGGATTSSSSSSSKDEQHSDVALGVTSNHEVDELIKKVEHVEHFLSHDEQWVFVNWATVFITLILVFVFTWQGGLIAVALFVLSQIFDQSLSKCRRKDIDAIDENTSMVSNRLVDVLKNKERVKLMDMSKDEKVALQQLERESDKARMRDMKLKVLGRILDGILSIYDSCFGHSVGVQCGFRGSRQLGRRRRSGMGNPVCHIIAE